MKSINFILFLIIKIISYRSYFVFVESFVHSIRTSDVEIINNLIFSTI